MLREAWRRVRLAGDSLASLRQPGFGTLRSQAPSANQVGHPRYQYWLRELHETNEYHRKVWEWCFIMEGAEQAGVLKPGARALGFGVGKEPLVAALAARQLEVVATDQPETTAGSWTETDQHAAGLAALANEGLCPPDQFARLVSFRAVDMTALPNDLRDFDLTWSSCCFEHLGTAQKGLEFVVNSLDCLRPGGVAVHTTEYDTVTRDVTAIDDLSCYYQRRDFEALVLDLRHRGHDVRCNFKISYKTHEDRFVDRPPYVHGPHLKYESHGVVATSFGLIIKKGQRGR